MASLTQAQCLARFVDRARFESLSGETVLQLKLRVLDSLAVGIGALDAPTLRGVRAAMSELGGTPGCTLIGGGAAKSSPDRAAFYNGALIRYLDFNDAFLAKNETCHPSDNLAPVLAAAEYADAHGTELLTALAVAYQAQIRLSEAAPVRARGFDHTTQGAYAASCGVCKALRLPPERTANALAICGASNNALRVTRTGALSNWKGLAYPQVAFNAVWAAMLAKHGITGPLEVFEGNKGFEQSISGPFRVDWENETLEGVGRTVLKKYDAEIHSQSAIEGVLKLKARHRIDPSEIERIDLSIFQVAYDIIGGGQEGGKTEVRTKEEADHSLPYIVAVACLDGQVMPEQYEPRRIASPDAQALLRRVHVKPDAAASSRFPEALPVRIRILLRNGKVLSSEETGFEGYVGRPMPWEGVERKFHHLATPFCGASERSMIIEAVRNLESVPVRDFTRLLAQASLAPAAAPRTHHETPRSIRMAQDRAFSFIPLHFGLEKPRLKGLTEIRGPYYTVMGTRYLSDVLETMGSFVDGLKFAGGSFALMPSAQVRQLIELAHAHDVYVSTGGWIEHVLAQGGPKLVDRYIDEAADLGFDVLEISTGFITLSADDLLRLVDRVTRAGMKAKPELGIQFGAGGATRADVLKEAGTRDVGWLISQGRRCLDAGAHILMIESEGITECVGSAWRTDVIVQIVGALGLENVMFEAADPEVFEWYVRTYGPDVNLFVDHSQIVQLSALRSGIWGTQGTWGRITSYRPETAAGGEKKKAA